MSCAARVRETPRPDWIRYWSSRLPQSRSDAVRWNRLVARGARSSSVSGRSSTTGCLETGMLQLNQLADCFGREAVHAVEFVKPERHMLGSGLDLDNPPAFGQDQVHVR